MNTKKLISYFVVYALLIVLVLVFAGNFLMSDMPKMNYYQGDIEFKGENAYEDLKHITKNFPKRDIGSDNAEKSGQWIEDRFKDLGFETRKEDFEVMSFNEDPVSLSMNDLYNRKKGINVIGISKGKKDDIVLIGAHRDTTGTIEGAQDNGTGTAVMLELARVLTSKSHQYTYMFLSFDGEEIGLKGSEDFVKKNPHLKIKLAMVLDCVGYKDADTLGLYQYESSKGASPLWTTAIAQSILKSHNMPIYHLDMDGGVELFGKGFSESSLERIILKRILGTTNTDVGPFVDRNVPTVGFISAKTGKNVDHEGVFHTEKDTISYVSKESMEKTGKIAEQYIMSLDLNKLEGDLKSNMYVVIRDKYIGFMPLFIFVFLTFLCYLCFWFLKSKEALKNPEKIYSFLKKEAKWIILILLLSIYTGMYWQIFNINLFSGINIIILLFVWSTISTIGISVIFVARLLKVKKEDYNETTDIQGILLNTVYFFVFIITALLYNGYIAIFITAFPMIILGRITYRSVKSRILWIMAFGVWSLIHVITTILCFLPYIFDTMSVEGSIIITLNVVMWNFSFVYLVSAPERIKTI